MILFHAGKMNSERLCSTATHPVPPLHLWFSTSFLWIFRAFIPKIMKPGLAFAVLFILASCRKEEDRTPPSLTVLEPAGGTNRTGGQSIHFRAELSDEEGLDGLHVQVTAAGGGAVLFSEFFPATGTEVLIDDYSTAGTIYTLTGDYVLEFIAVDLAGNQTTVNLPLHIDEAPLERVKVAWLGKLNSSTTARLHVRDSSGTMATASPSFSLPAFLHGSGYYQEIAVAEKQSGGRLTGIDAFSLQTVFNEYYGGASGQDILTDISHYQKGEFLTSFTLAPYLLLINGTGFTIFSYTGPLAQNPCTAVEATADFHYVAQNLNGAGTQWGIYQLDPSPARLEASRFMNWNVSSLEAAGPDVMLAAGNGPAGGKVLAMTADGLDSLAFFNLSDSVICMSQGRNFTFVQTQSAVYRFDPANLSLQDCGIPGVWNCMTADRSRDEVLVGGMNTVSSYTSGGVLVDTWTGLWGDISSLEVVYNK